MKVELGDYITEYSVRNKTGEDIPVYSVTNTQGFCRDYFGKEVASKDKTTYKIVPRGCFAYNPSRINVGSVDWQRNEERVIVSPLYNVFSVSPELDQQYLYYFLKSDISLHYIRNAATGSVRDNLKLDMLKKFPIELPDLQTQFSIVKTIDSVVKVIELHKTMLNSFDDLIKARFVEMFGSVKEERILGEISEFVTVGIANSATHAYADFGIPMLRNQNIKENSLDDKDLIYITPEFAKQYESKKLKENDIIAMRTGYPGVACLVPKKYEGCQTFTTLIVRLKEGNNPNYICSYINSDFGKKFIETEKVGVAQQNLGAKSLAKMPIKIAPKDLQNQFADFVTQIDKSKVVVQKALDEAQLLFDSLMQKYFG